MLVDGPVCKRIKEGRGGQQEQPRFHIVAPKGEIEQARLDALVALIQAKLDPSPALEVFREEITCDVVRQSHDTNKPLECMESLAD